MLGIADTVFPGILTEVLGKCLLRKRGFQIVLAPPFISCVEMHRSGSSTLFQPNIAGGIHELDNVVTFLHSLFQIPSGPVADGKFIIVGNQSSETFQTPKQDTFCFLAQFFGKKTVIDPVFIPFLCCQDDLTAVKTMGTVI